MGKLTLSEQDLARHVVTWLQDYGWEVYQEVQPSWGGPIADIVAVQGPLLWVVECKTSFGIAVMEQAYHWEHYAHLTSVATPPAKANRRWASRWFRERVLFGATGIGHLVVHPSMSYLKGGESPVEEAFKPRLRRRISRQLRESLVSQQKTEVEAGSANGGHWTPFRQTCRHLRDFVATHPGCSIKDAVGAIDHHYNTPASARSSLRVWIEKGRVTGVRSERDGRLIKLFASEVRA
jgi:hypothetical protein